MLRSYEAMDHQTNIAELNEGDTYRIRVKGILNEGWVYALQMNVVSTHRHYTGVQTTTLLIRVADQGALMGVLNRLQGMNFKLLAVEQWPTE